MKISAIQTSLKPNIKNITKPASLYQNQDSFVHSGVSFGEKESFLSKLASKMFEPYIPTEYTGTVEQVEVTDFHKEIAQGLTNKWGKIVPPSNLKSLVSPKEIKEILPSLQEENFSFTNEGYNDGTYFIDLDNDSVFSNGKYPLTELLDKVAIFADKYYAKHKKEFIFALTDRDSIESVQQAVRIISEDPERFKHLKFIPAVKLTFAHEAPTSNIGYENSEMLVYGINPFSENIVNFVNDSIDKRYKMILEFIRKVSSLYPDFAYNITEFVEQNRLKYSKNYTISNLYWRAREYAETKGGTVIKGSKINQEQVIKSAHAIINELDQVYTASRNRQTKSTFVNEDEQFNRSIQNVFDEYSTHEDKEKGKVVSSAENLYDDMIECFSKENEKPCIAFSAPYYLSHYFEEEPRTDFKNVVAFLSELGKKSEGMLVAFETVVPRYEIDKDLQPKKLEEFNRFIRENTNLYEVGGSFINEVVDSIKN